VDAGMHETEAGKKMSEKSKLKLVLNHNHIADLNLHWQKLIILRMKNKQ
jgi:hypothetical protein